jgi:Plasmid pRiA4b ORF-3-like protein
MHTPIMTPSVYQLRVILQGISPLIWRRLLIRSDMLLAALHNTLQIVFAWRDVQLHGFRIHGKAYGSMRFAGPNFDADSRQVLLAALGLHRGERHTQRSNYRGSDRDGERRP